MSYDQWTEECPKCHNRECLTVFQVMMVATGETVYPETRLFKDGFIVDPTGDLKHLNDQSTTDEKVRCDTCGEIFELSDLFIPEPFPDATKKEQDDFSVRIIWGSDPIMPCEYRFKTKVELDAFTLGVNEAFQEQEVKIVNEDGEEIR